MAYVYECRIREEYADLDAAAIEAARADPNVPNVTPGETAMRVLAPVMDEQNGHRFLLSQEENPDFDELKINGIQYFAAQEEPSKCYGILVSPQNQGIYVPVGRQGLGGGRFLEPVPICVGGTREVAYFRGRPALEAESVLECIRREAEEELQQPVEPFLVRSPEVYRDERGRVTIRRVTLTQELSTWKHTWHVRGSEEVTAVIWMSSARLRRIFEDVAWVPGAPGDMLADILYFHLDGNPRDRRTWLDEWFGRAYSALGRLEAEAWAGGRLPMRSWRSPNIHDVNYLSQYEPRPEPRQLHAGGIENLAQCDICSLLALEQHQNQLGVARLWEDLGWPAPD